MNIHLIAALCVSCIVYDADTKSGPRVEELRERIDAVIPPAPVGERDIVEQLAKSAEAMNAAKGATEQERAALVDKFVEVFGDVARSNTEGAAMFVDKNPFTGWNPERLESACCAVTLLGEISDLIVFSREIGETLVAQGRLDEAKTLSTALCNMGHAVAALNESDHHIPKTFAVAAYLAALDIDIAASVQRGDAERRDGAERVKAEVIAYHEEVVRTFRERGW